MKLEDIFKAIEDMRDKASVNAVFGEPVELDERTIIPVADIKYGFGLGYGEGPAGSTEDTPAETSDEGAFSSQGGGVGGGIAARPVAVVEVSEQGVRIKPVMDESRITLAGIFTGAWFIFWTAKTLKAIFGKK
jgi:uncharacterized spore protein YtfJ